MDNRSTKEYIEIIDYYPSILRSKIPLVHMFVFTLYYLISPFYILYNFIKNKKKFSEFFKKKKYEEFCGSENFTSTFVDFSGLELTLPTQKVIKTENLYFYNEEAKNIIKDLVASGEFTQYQQLSNNYIIKIKKVIIASEEEIKSSKVIMLSYPRLAVILKNKFKFILK